MALVGYEAEIGKINAAIAGIRARLGEQPVGSDGQTGPKKHRMSASARRRIATAQRKRWAAVKNQAQTKGAAKRAPKKRKMSAAARKKIGDATRKRWAAQRRAAGQKATTASA
jgi:hypothetical protein